MSHVPGAQGHQGTGHQGNAPVGDLIPEDAAQAQQRVGQHIIQQAHQDCVHHHGPVAEIAGLEGGGNGVGAHGHLHQRVGKACGQAPLHPMAIGDQHNGQHAHQGQLAAERHGGDHHSAGKLQHHSQSNEHGALGQPFCLVVHENSTSCKKCRIANPSRCNATRSGISYVHLSLRRY